MPDHVHVSDARERIYSIVREAEAGNETVLTRYGHPLAVVVGIEQYRMMREATELNLLRNFMDGGAA